jgi:hypothetical protein
MNHQRRTRDDKIRITWTESVSRSLGSGRTPNKSKLGDRPRHGFAVGSVTQFATRNEAAQGRASSRCALLGVSLSRARGDKQGDKQGQDQRQDFGPPMCRGIKQPFVPQGKGQIKNRDLVVSGYGLARLNWQKIRFYSSRVTILTNQRLEFSQSINPLCFCAVIVRFTALKTLSHSVDDVGIKMSSAT